MKQIYENSSNEKQKFLSKNMYQKIFSILFEQLFLYILEKKAKKKKINLGSSSLRKWKGRSYAPW